MDLNQVSKYMSLILRHKPEVIGITLDEHGWADMYKLILGIRKKYPGFGIHELIYIVMSDEKQRYSFSEDGTKVRANQGHSIPVDLELEAKEPPRYLYHGTAKKYVKSIEKGGLKPKSRQYVHLSKDVETAIEVGKRHGEPVVYSIESDLMYKCDYKFYMSENGVWLTKEVPFRYMDELDIRYIVKEN